ncbi:hypothetical protein GCM10023310_70770 [Paenibacillus vulneris]|uniref:Uncharacterized protein n=1 Tax=Paenibacillus vulneris TaxID=1133364 RepID=A0ABW3UGP5_9BACL
MNKNQYCMCGNNLQINMIDVGTVDDCIVSDCEKCSRQFIYQFHGENGSLINIKELHCPRNYKTKVYYISEGNNVEISRSIAAKDIDTVEWILNQLYNDLRGFCFIEEWAKQEKIDWDWNKVCEAM